MPEKLPTELRLVADLLAVWHLLLMSAGIGNDPLIVTLGVSAARTELSPARLQPQQGEHVEPSIIMSALRSDQEPRCTVLGDCAIA
jgi:hypothetical protein